MGASSPVPAFPPRSALISPSVISWIVFDVLHSFGRKSRLCCNIAAGRTKHARTGAQAVFSLPTEDALFDITALKLCHQWRDLWGLLELVPAVGNGPGRAGFRPRLRYLPGSPAGDAGLQFVGRLANLK